MDYMPRDTFNKVVVEKDATIARLTAERDQWRKSYHTTHELFMQADARADKAEAERDAWKARAEAAEAALRFGVDLIEGDSFGSEWKKGCADFRRMARAHLADLTQDQPHE
jgi:ATPase subunit of ABC transporter with duplicated ATPase domains